MAKKENIKKTSVSPKKNIEKTEQIVEAQTVSIEKEDSESLNVEQQEEKIEQIEETPIKEEETTPTEEVKTQVVEDVIKNENNEKPAIKRLFGYIWNGQIFD